MPLQEFEDEILKAFEEELDREAIKPIPPTSKFVPLRDKPGRLNLISVHKANKVTPLFIQENNHDSHNEMRSSGKLQPCRILPAKT
jgi:hypothetical protein